MAEAKIPQIQTRRQMRVAVKPIATMARFLLETGPSY